MSVRSKVRHSYVPEAVVDFEQGGLSANAVRLWALLDRYGNSEGAVANPGRKRLAQRLGMSVDTLDRAKLELEQGGWLTVRRNIDRERERNDTNEYILHVEPVEAKHRTKPVSRTTAARGDSRTGAANGSRTGAALQVATRTERSVANATDAPTLPGIEVPVAEKPKRKRQPDLLWDAMVEAMGTAPPMTDSARGAWRKAVKELRDAGATPDEVRNAAVAYRKEWPNITITPTALAKHWHVFVGVADQQTPMGKAQRWVRTAGRELPDGVFDDLLAERKGLADHERDALRALRAQLVDENAAAAHLADEILGGVAA